MKKGTFSSKGWEKLSIKSGINPKMAQRIQYQERVIEYGPSQQEEIKFTQVLRDIQQRSLRKNDPLSFLIRNSHENIKKNIISQALYKGSNTLFKLRKTDNYSGSSTNIPSYSSASAS